MEYRTIRVKICDVCNPIIIIVRTNGVRHYEPTISSMRRVQTIFSSHNGKMYTNLLAGTVEITVRKETT